MTIVSETVLSSAVGMKKLHFFADDLTAAQTWELLEWCSSNGASEFTLNLLGFLDSPAPRCDEYEAAFRAFQLAESAREHLTAPSKSEVVRPTRLWRLCSESQSVLECYLTEGLLTFPTYAEEGWFEDPTFYRDGKLMLGIVSHEGEGLGLVTADKALQFQALRIHTRPSAEWI